MHGDNVREKNVSSSATLNDESNMKAVPVPLQTVKGFRSEINPSYDSSILPTEGWFRNCSTCDRPTVHYIIVNKTDKFYSCRRCQKKQAYRRFCFLYTHFDVELV